MRGAVKVNSQRNQSGVAMIIALFALLLLSVVGLGMMYSTNMETSINGNYRDKQEAFYAALAGLQEARDRIQPSWGDIPAPTALPSTSFQNVIYILSDASTVKPWDPTKKYFDTELCQEKVMGLSGTSGVPCTTIASGSTWYKTYDHSLGGIWNLPNPLDLKWVRITVKGNNMTPVPVNGDNTVADQACWNGANQMSTPSTYTTGCRPKAGVTAIFVTSSGGGYSSSGPAIVITGDGTGATATAVMQPETTGYVASITLTTGGSAYTIAPTVTITGDGTGATATAVLSSTGTVTTTPGAVTSVTMTTGGAYAGPPSPPPTVNFSGGGGTGASAVAVLSSSGTVVTDGYVTAVTVNNGGSGYTSPPTVNFSGGGGSASGAAATAVLGTSGKVVSLNVSSLGTQCYSQASDVVVSFSPGSGSGATAVGVLEPTRSCIYSASVTAAPNCNNKLSSANGYSPPDQKSSVTFNDVGNKSAYGTLHVSTADDKSPSSFLVNYPGHDATGYSASTFSSTLTIYVSPGTTTAWPIHSSQQDCNNIQVTATTGYRLQSITVTDGGSGYTSTPTVNITGGTGDSSGGSTYPAATATLGFPVSSVTVISGGNHYTSAPTVSFTGGGGGCGVCTSATATASVVTTSTWVYPVDHVTVTAGGSGYTSPPSVSFGSTSGSGAAAMANISGTTATTYPVDHVDVNTGGSGYTSALTTVSFSGGGGMNAAATATIGQQLTGGYSVNTITVNTAGSGYTYDPTITICGTNNAGMFGCPIGSGPGSGATAVSQINGGVKYGKVYLVTALAQTKTGGRSMLQMEVSTPVMGFGFGGALTLDGPNPVIDAMPNSLNFTIKGADKNLCNDIADPDHPAIDGYDDPNASPPTHSVEDIISSLPRPDHYTGSGGTPSVQNGYASLGESMGTPAGLESLINTIYNKTGANHYGNNPSSIALGDCPTHNTSDASCHTIIDYVEGDLTLNGNATGYGTLVVTGTLTMSGNFTWYGLVLVIGDGHMEFNGGGNGQIIGQLIDAKIWDSYTTKTKLSSLGSPTFKWNGGGVNAVQFDHCWSTKLMDAFNWTPPPTTKPLKVLSFRILPY